MTMLTAVRRVLGRLRAIWRCQRGVTGMELVAGVAALFALYAAYEVFTRKVPALQAELIQLKPCLAKVSAAIEGLKCRYGEYESGLPCETPNAKFLGFPQGLEIVANDPTNITFEECKAEMARFSDKIKQGNHATITKLTEQINEYQQLFGKCAITSKFREGTAGVPYQDVVEAYIPFSSVPATGQIAVTGLRPGGGGFKSTKAPNWIGSVNVPTVFGIEEAGTESQVTVTATTMALAPRAPDGVACYPGSEPVDSRCVYVVRPDGTCPAGLTPGADNRCFFSCTTPAKAIGWKAPPPAKVDAFTVTPNAIDKGSKDPVTLSWVVSNSDSVGINQGVGDFSANPTKTTNGSVTLNPPPDQSTTWTLLALGPGGKSSASATATLVVKESAATVAITSPQPNAQILDFSVVVSGVITPVPDEAHRKAQILVNGAFLAEATINAAGQFSAGAPLQNTIGLSDLIVFGSPAVGVTSCGPASAPITLGAFAPNGAKNLIRVIVPLASGSASSSVQVEHVISVNRFGVVWGGGCGPAPSQNNALGIVVRDGEASTPVGSVLCGFPGPAHCTDIATITVGTSVGSKVVTQTWTADINSCL
jgi:hypothetical protein